MAREGMAGEKHRRKLLADAGHLRHDARVGWSVIGARKREDVKRDKASLLLSRFRFDVRRFLLG